MWQPLIHMQRQKMRTTMEKQQTRALTQGGRGMDQDDQEADDA